MWPSNCEFCEIHFILRIIYYYGLSVCKVRLGEGHYLFKHRAVNVERRVVEVVLRAQQHKVVDLPRSNCFARFHPFILYLHYFFRHLEPGFNVSPCNAELVPVVA